VLASTAANIVESLTVREQRASCAPDPGAPPQRRPDLGTIGVILKGYPRLSETFIAQELHGLEQHGYTLRIYAMRFPHDDATHPIHAEIRAPVSYLPEYLHREPLRVAGAIYRQAFQPRFKYALRAWLRDVLRDPTPNRVRRFGQACVLADELPDDVTWLYAHFIHTPAAVTRYTALMSDQRWSCSAHAKDIWTSPDWDLAQSLQSAEWVATCTKVGREKLASLAPNPELTHLVYHGLDLDRFASPASDRAHQTTMRDGSDRSRPLRILCVGRAVRKKGIDTLLKALARLPPDLHWTFTHIGGGGESGSLKRMACDLGLADRICWRGACNQTDVLKAYRESDVFVLSSRVDHNGDRDGLPNVLVEAQSQGLACISTPTGAISELIEPDVTGTLVPSDNPEALSAAIVKLARDPALRRRLGAVGQARVRDHFAKDAGLARLTALFAASLAWPHQHEGPSQETDLSRGEADPSREARASRQAGA